MIKPETTKLQSGTWLARLGAVEAYGSTETKAKKAWEAKALSALASAGDRPDYMPSKDGSALFVTHASHPTEDAQPSFGYDIVDVQTGRVRCSTGMSGDFRAVRQAAHDHAADYA